MRRVLCVVLLVALGDAAVRYPRGYSIKTDLQYGDNSKTGAFYDLRDSDATKGSKYIKDGKFGSKTDVGYLLLIEKDNEIHKKEESTVRVISAVKYTEHSSVVESSDNIRDTTLSSDFIIGIAPITIFQSSLSTNLDHSIEVKSSSNIPSDSVIGSDTVSVTEGSSSSDIEDSGGNINDTKIVVKGSYSSVSEYTNVMSDENSGFIFDTVLGFFTNNDHNDKIKSSSINEKLHRTETESSDGDSSIINFLLSFFTNKHDQDATKSSSFSNFIHSSQVNIGGSDRTTAEVELNDTRSVEMNNQVIQSISTSEVDESIRIKVDNVTGNAIHTQLLIKKEGSGENADHDNDTISINKLLKSETELSTHVKSEDIDGSLIKTIVIDTENRQEAAGVVNSSSYSYSELISNVKSLYNKGSKIFRTMLSYFLRGHYGNDVLESSPFDGGIHTSEIKITLSDVPKIKNLLTYFPSEYNPVIKSSESGENGPIIEPVISGSITYQDQSDIVNLSVSTDTYSSGVKSIDEDSKLKIDSGKYTKKNDYISDVKSSDNIYETKILLSDSAIGTGYGKVIENNSNGEEGQKVENNKKNDSVITNLSSDSIISHNYQISVFESNLSGLKASDSKDSTVKNVSSDLTIANDHRDAIKNSYTNDGAHIGDVKTSENGSQIETHGSCSVCVNHHDNVIKNISSGSVINQNIPDNNTLARDITNRNDSNLKIGGIRFSDMFKKNKGSAPKRGDIESSNSGYSSYDHSTDADKDKINWNQGHGTHHHVQSGDKNGSHHYSHIISHKHSDESSESSSSSEESTESKESSYHGYHQDHKHHHDESKESDERDSSHSHKYDHDVIEEKSKDSHHHKYGHSITKRSSDRSILYLEKSETKPKHELKTHAKIKSAVEGQRIKRYGGYYRYNQGRSSEVNRETYKRGYYRHGHSDSDSDSTSEERSEERNWYHGSWHRGEAGRLGHKARRFYGGYHYKSGESFDNSNEGGEREYYYNQHPGFGFAYGPRSRTGRERY